jgi:tRNA threonylcarbamoyladenosine biosynthesis protein TsaB
MGRIYNSLAEGQLNKQDSTTSELVILALDTSARATRIAVSRGARLLKSIDAPADERRSENLWSDVQSLLTELDVSIGDVDVFSVCVGPGSFTGVRVGMAAAKGFSAAGSKPIVGVTSLEAAAFTAGPALPVCSMVTAYKGDVYSQLFSFDEDGVPAAQNAPMVSTFEKALERVAGVKELVLAGDGAEAGVDGSMSNGHQLGQKKVAIRRADHNLAEDIAQLALLKIARGEVETAESLKACYVRPAEAEIKLSLGLLGSKIKRSMKSR